MFQLHQGHFLYKHMVKYVKMKHDVLSSLIIYILCLLKTFVIYSSDQICELLHINSVPTSVANIVGTDYANLSKIDISAGEQHFLQDCT